MNLQHSAKGSTWKDHKYIKRLNGTYYYPKGYKGGRQLPDSAGGGELEDWEKTMYEDIEATLKKNPGLFDPSQITDDNWQDFGLTLAEFAGVDADKLSKEEIERMRQKVADHYAQKESESKLDKEDVEALANEVIRGNFGNGTVRKDLLGEDYSEVQKKVNEILKKNKSLTSAKKGTRPTDVKHSELYHHGVLGQRWGVRRYQNSDGTLTAAGRRRLQGSGISSDENSRVSSDNSGRARGAIHQTVANDYKNASAGLQSASNAARAASSINDRAAGRKQAKAMNQMDLSKMTDKDLQAAINRLNLERNYKALSTEHIKSGRDYVSSFMSIAGDTLAIGASAASIMMMIHQLKS